MAANRDMANATRGATDVKQFVTMLYLPCPEGKEKPTVGGGLRRLERVLSRTRVCVDRAGAFDDLSEGTLRLLYPP
jgi:hypothetical protein